MKQKHNSEHFTIILVVGPGPYMLKIWYLLVYVTRLMTTYITRISQMIAHHFSGTQAILCGLHQLHCSL
jgi:hypothetical protein